MSARDYKLGKDELLALGANRLADIDEMIALSEGVERAMWIDERAEQVRLMKGIK